MLVALLAVALLLPGCGTPAEAPPNVLLVVVDTLGASHLGSYGAEVDGGDEPYTPHTDRLAESGVRFERAYSAAPWTQPSVASLFTSQMPSRHGLTSLRGTLDDEADTLAERFEAAGYSTHAIVSHFLLGEEYGFRQGFGALDATSVTGHAGSSSRAVTDRALEWLDAHPGGPFFLFVHYFDPHFLYQDRRGFDYTGGYAGPLDAEMSIRELREKRDEMSAEDVAYLVALYREEIAVTDREIGRLLERVEAGGSETVVVLTSDHGEEFMEHGWIGHTRALWDEHIHVPLLVSFPGVVAPRVVVTPVSLLDLAPTLAELAGIEPGADWRGLSLAPLLLGREQTLPARSLFAEVDYAPPGKSAKAAEKSADQTALISGGFKLIHDRKHGRFSLYDWRRDPDEQHDLWGADPERDERLRQEILEWERSRAR